MGLWERTGGLGAKPIGYIERVGDGEAGVLTTGEDETIPAIRRRLGVAAEARGRSLEVRRAGIRGLLLGARGLSTREAPQDCPDTPVPLVARPRGLWVMMGVGVSANDAFFGVRHRRHEGARARRPPDGTTLAPAVTETPLWESRSPPLQRAS